MRALNRTSGVQPVFSARGAGHDGRRETPAVLGIRLQRKHERRAAAEKWAILATAVLPPLGQRAALFGSKVIRQFNWLGSALLRLHRTGRWHRHWARPG